MHRIIITLIVAVFAVIYASAKIEFQSLNNIGSTNIVLVYDSIEGEGKVTVAEAVLHNNGKSYEATAIHCKSTSGKITINLKFKRFKRFSNCSVILTVNGEKVVIPIQEHLIKTLK